MLAILTFFIGIGVCYSAYKRGVMTELLDRFRLDDSEETIEEEQDIEPAPEPKVIYSKDRRVTIFPKQKKGRGAKYYPEETKRLVCDLVTYKDGVLVCHLKDSMLEEEFNIKDIESFII